MNYGSHFRRRTLAETVMRPPRFPNLRGVQLVDYKVRVINSEAGTAAAVRVVIESQDADGTTWGTVGVAHNIIDASWQALVDSVEYKLRRDERR